MLFKKAVRAIWSNKKSYIACIFLIAVGIMMYTAMSIAGEGLETAMLKFYKDYRLSDVFARVDAMPEGLSDIFLEIEGVQAAELRYVCETRAEVNDSDEIITLRLISVDTDNNARLNDLLITGNSFTDENDIMLNPTFFDAHNLSIGDEISLFVNGREYVYNVCATVLSPEYVYITKSGTDILPDESGFGIGYITKDSMASLTNSAGIANDIVFKLKEGYAFDDVKVSLEDSLDPYGLKELIDKEDQLSYAFLQSEVMGIRSVSTSLPMVFVLMAVVVLYLMMKRVIEQDRSQIGTLKAFGYSNIQILFHYLLYGGVTGVLGGLLGWVAGFMLSGMYLKMFLQFFLLPQMTSTFDLMFLVNSMMMAVGGGLIGAFTGAFKVLSLNPAEAMRPESPRPVKYDIVGKIKIFKVILSSRGSMALRNIIRNMGRSMFIVLGVMFSFSLLSIAGSFTTLIEKMIYGQFVDIRLYNVKITLNNPVDYNTAVEDAYAIDYITHAEGLLEIPVELKNRHLKEGIVLTGVPEGSALYKVSDTNTKTSYPPPNDGIILSNGIADKLKAKAGDMIYISSPLAGDDIAVYVSRVIEQNLSMGCYMELAAAAELFNLRETATSVILNTDNLTYLKDYLKNGENVYSIEDKDSTIKKYQDMMEMYTSIYLALEIMSALVAFAIIYNTSSISISERRREYATLRILGLSVNEVCEIISFEYWTLSLLAMAVGVPFTLLVNNSMNSFVDTSLYSMPSTLPAGAYLVGGIGCAAAILLSNQSAKKRIRSLSLVEVLKERE